MSSKDDRAFYGWLLYGEPFPFFKDLKDVPMPIVDKQPEVPEPFRAKLSDYWNGWAYVDGDGDIISKEEAQAEVDWLNGRSL